jgi:hypothetical protein
MDLRDCYAILAQFQLNIVGRTGTTKTAMLYDIDNSETSIPAANLPARVQAPHWTNNDLTGIGSFTVNSGSENRMFTVTELLLVEPVPAGEGIRAWLGELVDYVDTYRGMLQNRGPWRPGVLEDGSFDIGFYPFGNVTYAGVLITLRISAVS